MLSDWLKPEIIVGFVGVLIGAGVTVFIARKQFEQQVRQALQEKERAKIESEARYRQSVQAFVDYLYDVRSLNKPPAPSGEKLWGVAYKRLHEVRRRLTETLSMLPSHHIARDHLVRLLNAFHVWSDEWDKYGDYADTDDGQRYLMNALHDLQVARVNIEDELRERMNLPRRVSKDSSQNNIE